MFNKIKNNLYIQVFLISITIFIFIYYLLSNFLVSLNWEFLFFLKSTISSKESSNKNIVILEIDDLTYNKLWFPLSRDYYVPVLENLKEAQAWVIGFDILFLDKWSNPKNDLKLSRAFNNAWNVILWADIKNDRELIKPYKLFFDNVKNIWYFQPFIHPYTKKVYSVEPFRILDSWRKVVESFSFVLLREYLNYIYNKNDNLVDINVKKWIYNFYNKKVPVEIYKLWDYRKTIQFNINYIQSNKFSRESFYNVYKWKFDKDLFKDKLVLIWYTAEWVKDEFIVPWLWLIKWVYLNANIINTLLNENYVIHFNKKLELLISFIFILVIVYWNVFYLKHSRIIWLVWWSIFLFIILFSIYIFLFIYIFSSKWIYIIPNFPLEFLWILFLSFFASSILKYINEDKNKTLLNKALSEYISSDIAKEILYWSGSVSLSWERKKITIFFSDIAWFTTISEKLSPEELVSFLRVYLWKMSDIIIDYKWFINKYEWDAIMALWWVFGRSEKFWVYDACYSCILQQKALNELNKKWMEEWKEEIKVRMWLHTWEAIIWNIWSEWRKMEFTALWDSVNLASRLEWVNKFYWTNICVSEDVYNEVKNYFEFRYLDKIRVKWKSIPINIYELICIKWELSDFKKQIVKDFDNAMNYYFNRDFKKALEIFNKLEKLWDKPSITYKARSELYIKNPPDENWDFVWDIKEK